jgi:hypothetical protein
MTMTPQWRARRFQSLASARLDRGELKMPASRPTAGGENDAPRERIISVRKLAALDLALRGPRFILTEFAATTLVGLGIGLFVLWRSATQAGGPAIGSILFGAYMVAIGCNYVPLLVYAVGLARHGDAARVVAYELAHKEAAVRKYSTQQAPLLVPFAVLALALWQAWQAHSTR